MCVIHLYRAAWLRMVYFQCNFHFHDSLTFVSESYCWIVLIIWDEYFIRHAKTTWYAICHMPWINRAIVHLHVILDNRKNVFWDNESNDSKDWLYWLYQCYYMLFFACILVIIPSSLSSLQCLSLLDSATNKTNYISWNNNIAVNTGVLD